MTHMAHRVCGVDYGCVVPSHTSHDCYWRYMDSCLDSGRPWRTIVSESQWRRDKNAG